MRDESEDKKKSIRFLNASVKTKYKKTVGEVLSGKAFRKNEKTTTAVIGNPTHGGTSIPWNVDRPQGFSIVVTREPGLLADPGAHGNAGLRNVPAGGFFIPPSIWSPGQVVGTAGGNMGNDEIRLDMAGLAAQFALGGCGFGGGNNAFVMPRQEPPENPPSPTAGRWFEVAMGVFAWNVSMEYYFAYPTQQTQGELNIPREITVIELIGIAFTLFSNVACGASIILHKIHTKPAAYLACIGVFFSVVATIILGVAISDHAWKVKKLVIPKN